MNKLRSTWRKPQTAPDYPPTARYMPSSDQPPTPSYQAYRPPPDHPSSSSNQHMSRSFSVRSSINPFMDGPEDGDGPSEADVLAARAEQMSFASQAPEPLRQPSTASNDDAFSEVSEEAAEGDRSDQNNEMIVSQANISKGLYDLTGDLPLPLVPKQADEKFRATYYRGDWANRVRESARTLRVGLTFLPGADKPQVMRLEQAHMNPKEPPDQRTAEWRGKTAATLLKMHDITQQLELDVKYSPPKLISWHPERTRGMPDSNFYYPDGPHDRHRRHDSHHDVPNRNPNGTPIEPLGRQDEYDTIDSDLVKIVHDLSEHAGKFDTESTLVEVDHDAMVSLMVRYRHVVMRNGPQSANASVREVLDTMIEDARKLAQRSPILFRTSFRSVISRSKNTRYGVNTPQMFRTITTSKGITQLVSWSAAYYKSLDDPTNISEEQRAIKTKFLQMLVVLLSLLNDEDLESIRNYIESTFRLKGDRKSIEMLCLKVIPLMSINPKLFIMEMLRGFEGYKVYEPDEQDLATYWDEFLKRRIADQYILPGSLETLGRPTLSWIPAWPKEGLCSSIIFRDLQYAGNLQTINEIPQIDLRPQEENMPLAVILVNHERYLIDPKDYEQIVLLQSGRYTLSRSQTADFGDESNHCDMIIDEFWVNESTTKACSQLNDIIKIVNRFLDGRKKGGRLVKYGFKSISVDRFPEYRLRAGKITKHIARLGANTLAAAYKEKGYKVTKWDVAGHMNEDNQTMSKMLRQYRQHLADTTLNLLPQDISDMKHRLHKVESLIEVSVGIRKHVWNELVICNDPIVKVLRREGSDAVLAPEWQEYSAKLLPEWPFSPLEYDSSAYHSLEIMARRSTIRTLNWVSPDVAEVMLNDNNTTYFVSPLSQVDEMYQGDQIKIGDIGVLMGYYLVVAEQVQERSQEDMLYMANCLRITSVVQEQVQTMRGMRRQPQQPLRGARRGVGNAKVPCRFI
ncbi:hypothetical protein FGG08_005678 [Glutinoglossum americanum]|uniref:Uncharacterized protein n=1 Tax=Glutinoglossum americanum TaxID=1670608 RepID=A0A9P8I354_9PEZI|nr:hypothetical protein FGG08_005678 [Glutinoglossum americanum]